MNRVNLIKNLVLVAVMVLSGASYAQTESGQSGAGGGNWSEALIKNRLHDIQVYLESDEGKSAFPEVVEYSTKHPEESFSQLIQNLTPVLKNGPQQKTFDRNRDCVAHIDPKNRWFECNANALPEITRDNEPDFNRLWFHEALVQAGLEIQRGQEAPSTYGISSRMEFHIETYEKWMPGKQVTRDVQMMSQTGIFCTSEIEGQHLKESIVFIWRPNGDYVLLKLRVPPVQERYGLSSEQITNEKEWRQYRRRLNRADTYSHFFHENVSQRVIHRGHSLDLVRKNPSSLLYQHSNDPQYGFSVYTKAQLEKTPVCNNRGGDSEISLVLHVFEMPLLRNYQLTQLRCVGKANQGRNRLIPTDEIFANPHQSKFEQDYIRDQLSRFKK